MITNSETFLLLFFIKFACCSRIALIAKVPPALDLSPSPLFFRLELDSRLSLDERAVVLLIGSVGSCWVPQAAGLLWFFILIIFIKIFLIIYYEGTHFETYSFACLRTKSQIF